MSTPSSTAPTLLVNNSVCSVDDGSELEKLAFLPLPIIAFCLNFLLFLTTAINRKKLERQNYVYLCVISTLLSNVFFTLLQTWYMFDTYYGVFNRTQTRAKTIWTLCQAAIISIQYGMAGNICTLLYVLLDSTYFVGRSVNKKASDFVSSSPNDDQKNGKRRWSLSGKRRRAVLLIAWHWVIPISLIVAATATWNCDHDCHFCPHGFAKELKCRGGAWCSRIWSPLRNDFLCLLAALWITEVVGLLVVIFSGIRSFRQVMTPPQPDSSSISVDGGSDLIKGDESRSFRKSPRESVVSANINLNNNRSMDELTPEPSLATKGSVVGSQIGLSSIKYFHKRRRSQYKLHSRITFMIVLSTTFIICTLPSFITYILDVTETVVNYEIAMSVSFTAVYLYIIACPLILLKYLPNLQSTLIVMIRNCSIGRVPGVQRRHSTNKIVRKA